MMRFAHQDHANTLGARDIAGFFKSFFQGRIGKAIVGIDKQNRRLGRIQFWFGLRVYFSACKLCKIRRYSRKSVALLALCFSHHQRSRNRLAGFCGYSGL